VSRGLAALSWTLIEKPYLTGKRRSLRAVSDGAPIHTADYRRSG
jgi:peptidoglycan/LPS O-acetylase OafA/YrhL